MPSRSTPPGKGTSAKSGDDSKARSQSAQVEKERTQVLKEKFKLCQICGSEFSLFRRKKVCYCCDRVVCGNCSVQLKNEHGKAVGGGLFKSGAELCTRCNREGKNNGNYRRSEPSSPNNNQSNQLPFPSAAQSRANNGNNGNGPHTQHHQSQPVRTEAVVVPRTKPRTSDVESNEMDRSRTSSYKATSTNMSVSGTRSSRSGRALPRRNIGGTTSNP
eukprot:PhF_6_TR29542/c0_g1_i1/m.43719